MNWLTIIKYGIPAAAVAGFYFWAHNLGWNDRDKDVAVEIKQAVDSAVKSERSACIADIKLTGKIAYELQKNLDDANNRYADAIGSLYDVSHTAGSGKGASGAADRDNDAPGAGRLYYADPEGAIPAIKRATIATKQAKQLIGCQSYISAIRELKSKKQQP